MAPQPPGPGFPLHAPSVKISTSGIDAIRGRAGDTAVKPQPLHKFERILGAQQSARGLVDPVVKPGEQEPQRTAAGERGRSGKFGAVKEPDLAVMADKEAGLGHVEAEIRLEAPSVEAYRDVVGEKIGAGKIEIDQSREIAITEKYIVRKQVGVNDARRQNARPGRFKKVYDFLQ